MLYYALHASRGTLDNGFPIHVPRAGSMACALAVHWPHYTHSGNLRGSDNRELNKEPGPLTNDLQCFFPLRHPGDCSGPASVLLPWDWLLVDPPTL